jgi:S1-C subfamily serine protease
MTRTKPLIPLILTTVVALSLTSPAESAAADPREATVKIYVVRNDPNYYDPWSTHGATSASGSGCIISGKRILTNAHVVSNATFIQVRRSGSAVRFPARVLAVSHEADLGLITVDDADFFRGIAPLELGNMPKSRSEVSVYGFPLGGDTLSITKGVISRVEHQTYAHSSAYLLTAQIDAAINPGNSGGPAIVDGRIVGVAMQVITNAQNIGYVVPAPVIRHFLEDVADGLYDGYPKIGFWFQRSENVDLRAKYGVPETATGVLVTRIVPGAEAEGKIEAGDFVIAVDGHPVANDGTVEFRTGERTLCSYYAEGKQIGESINVTVWREGSELEIAVPLDKPFQNYLLVPLEQYDRLPTYYIFGGVVFCPLTKSLLLEWGQDWEKTSRPELRTFLSDNFRSKGNEEVVIILKILAAEVNAGYVSEELQFKRVVAVNGKEIVNTRDLIVLAETDTGEPHVTFETEQGEKIVFERTKALAARDAILVTYRIPADRSPDLLPDQYKTRQE